ncbi:uncharacterized protein ISCGN_031317 [Ixodes scapularis]
MRSQWVVHIAGDFVPEGTGRKQTTKDAFLPRQHCAVISWLLCIRFCAFIVYGFAHGIASSRIVAGYADAMSLSIVVFLSTLASLVMTTAPGCQAMPLHTNGGDRFGRNVVGPAVGNCTKDSKAKAVCDECIFVTGARESYEPCCRNTNHLQEYCEHFLRYAPRSLVNVTATERQPLARTGV